MLSGNLDTGKTIMRDYIKATVGFEKLGAATGAPQGRVRAQSHAHIRSVVRRFRGWNRIARTTNSMISGASARGADSA
jgi:hypothetical protein